ncbi:MAG: hypothetical protein JW803_02645 [Endomicrobiales bacterium]|nr:hypothetical protein [Endomicrobiales bacterium]
MRKIIALCLVAVLASSSFAYVPLSGINTQTNLGSFRNGATRGMFLEEVDIISANPVSLTEYMGTNLYTNWGNLRYANDPTSGGGVVTAVPIDAGADRAFTYDAAGRSQYFNFGMTGHPLSFIGLDSARVGVVYQNFGAKTVSYNLDNDAATGSGGSDSKGQWSATTLSDYDADLGVDRTRSQTSDLTYYNNTTNTQWDGGVAYKGLFLSDLVLGFSIARQSNITKRTTEGSKGYADRYLNDVAAQNVAVGMPAGARTGDTYSIGYADEVFDVNSMTQTDVLFQGRYPIFGLLVDAALGMRFQNNYNPDSNDAAQAITISGSEDLNTGTAFGAATPAQVYNTGTVISNRSNFDFNNFNIAATLLGNVTARAGLFTTAGAGANAAMTELSDDRKGSGPILRLEALKEMQKINLTGIFNLGTVTQNIAGKATLREYVATQLYVTATERDNYVMTDYTRAMEKNGDRKIGHMDIGGKIELKALEGMKLAFGGFINKEYDNSNYDEPNNTRETVSYDDGLAAVTPYAVVTTASKPGPATGEGTWVQTMSRTDKVTRETEITRYAVPVGTEIKLAKKWTFGCGTRYVMTKRTDKVRAETGTATTVTTQTPLGAAATVTQAISGNPSDSESVLYTETHGVEYTYGVRYNVNKNLTLACNAFLDTGANGAPAGNAARASLLDLDTYRLLAIQAVFHF